MALTQGLQLPFGVQPVNPVPVDAWSGPYIAETAQEAIDVANAAITPAIRFQSMEVRLIVGGVSHKYWYRNGVADTDLVPFTASNTGNAGYLNEIVFNEHVATTPDDVGLFFSLASTPSDPNTVQLWLNGQLLTSGEDYTVSNRLIQLFTSPLAPEDKLVASYSRPVALKQYAFGERQIPLNNQIILNNVPTSSNDVMIFLNGQLMLRGFLPGDGDYSISVRNVTFNHDVDETDVILATYSYS